MLMTFAKRQNKVRTERIAYLCLAAGRTKSTRTVDNDELRVVRSQSLPTALC